MRKEDIELCVNENLLRPRTQDIGVVKTLLTSAEEKSTAAKMLPIEEKTTTLIFLGLYESIRQLGDARWRLLGYESLSHDASMRILQEAEIKERTKLQKLDRFRRLRNDANYRGQKISVAEAKEILEFWDACGKELVEEIKKKV